MTGAGSGAWPPAGDPRGAGDAVSCEHFRDLVEDLALGEIDDPERARLFAHAAGCPACQARLDELALLADRLLLAAPELEPPAGFEGRVLDHLATAAGPPAAAAPAAARARCPWQVAPSIARGGGGGRRAGRGAGRGRVPRRPGGHRR